MVTSNGIDLAFLLQKKILWFFSCVNINVVSFIQITHLYTINSWLYFCLTVNDGLHVVWLLLHPLLSERKDKSPVAVLVVCEVINSGQ